jgi:hypothetical protein
MFLNSVTAYMDKHKNNIMIRSQAKNELLKLFRSIPFATFDCHDLKTLLLKKYISIKMHYWAKRITADPNIRSSKTVSGIMQT